MTFSTWQVIATALAPLLLPLAVVTKDPSNPWPHMSAGQREWVRRRDNYQCQYPVWNPANESFRRCGRGGTIHVHHILPKRAFWFWTKYTQDPHTPDNLVTLCVNCHEKNILICGAQTDHITEVKHGKKQAKLDKEKSLKVDLTGIPKPIFYLKKLPRNELQTTQIQTLRIRFPKPKRKVDN